MLAERDLELRALSRAAADATVRGARLVLITGEAGAGKSRLWSTFAESLPPAWSILEAGAHRTDHSPMAPFEPWVGAVSSRGEPGRALGGAVAEALEERARSGPVALLVEDLHWLDPVAISALSHLLRLLRHVPVLVVATFRVGEHPFGPQARAVAELLRQPGATELRLSPLSPGGVADVVNAMRGHDDPELAATVHERTGGNPFFVEELVREPGPALPWTVAEAVGARLQDLDAPDQRRAKLLALAGQPIPLRLLDDLEPEADHGAQRLVDSSLAVIVEDGCIGLRHALVGEVLRDQITLSDRRALHARLAEALELEPGVPPERLALHWSAAGEARRAAAWAATAADRLEGRRSYSTATDLYRLALRHPPEEPAAAAALHERAASAAAVAGELRDARTWAAEARRLHSRAGRWWRAGLAGVNPTLVELAGEPGAAPSGATPDLPSLVAQVQQVARDGDHDRGCALARLALEGARADGDLSMAGSAAITLVYSGDVLGGLEALEELGREARRGTDRDAEARLVGYLARATRILGDADGAIRINRRSLRLSKQAKDEEMWLHVQTAVAYVAAWHGHIDEAELLANEILAQDHTLFTAMAQVPLALIDLVRARLGDARARLHPLVTAVRALGLDYASLVVLRLMAHVELVEGNPATTLELLDEVDDVIWSPLYEWRGDLLELRGRAALAAGDADQVRTAASRLAELARSAPRGPMFVAPADTVKAMAEILEGRAHEAVARFEAAALAWERAHCWRPAAEAWCDAAEASINLAPGAPMALARARNLARTHGLSLVGARAEELAERAARTPGRPPQLADLTPRELDIARLVAAGRTNREIGEELILSEKTVRNYLSSAFAKLGITRRAEMAALLARIDEPR